MLCNGDTLFDVNIADLAALPVEGDWVGQLALRHAHKSSSYGEIKMEGARITSFAQRGNGDSAIINGGVYVLRRTVLDYLESIPCSLEKDIFPEVARDGRLYGNVYDSFFIDIGIPDDLERAQLAVPEHIRIGHPVATPFP